MQNGDSTGATSDSCCGGGNCCCCELTNEQKKAVGFYGALLAAVSICTLGANCLVGGSIFTAAAWCNLAMNDACVTGTACIVSHSKPVRDCATLFGQSAANTSIQDQPRGEASPLPARRSAQPKKTPDPTTAAHDAERTALLGSRR